MIWTLILTVLGGAIQALAGKYPAAAAVLQNAISEWSKVAHQTAQWTPEEEAAFDAHYRTITSGPHWQPLPPAGG